MLYGVSAHSLEIEVNGDAILTLIRPRCVLADVISDVARPHGDSLRCTLPALPGVGYTVLSLSDVTLADELLVGAIRAPAFPRAGVVQPPAGSTDGGAVLTLMGTGFDGASTQDSWCLMGGTKGPAAFVSSALVVCEAPPVPPSLYQVLPGGKNTALATASGSSAAVFWSLQDPFPLSLYPGLGPLLGGTTVTVHGTGLSDVDAVLCRVGTVGPLSTLGAGDGALTCVMPARSAGAAALVLGLNPQQYSAEVAALQFMYAAAPEAQGVTPERGPVHGEGLLSVLLNGADLSTAALLCVTGSSIAPPLVTSSTVATCKLLPGSAGFTRIAVVLTTDDTSATAGVDFLFHEPVVVRFLLPSTASTMGGTLVHVSGANFVPLETAYLSRRDMGATTAHVVSSALALCESLPARSEGAGDFTVVRGGLPSSDLPAQLTYAAPTVVSSVVPAAGPAMGGVLASVGGQNLHDIESVACWFGTFGPLMARVAAADALECLTPGHVPAVVPVVAAWLGEYFAATSDHLSSSGFTYWPQPDSHGASWPDAVPALGGTSVLLALSNLPPGVPLVALMGRMAVAIVQQQYGADVVLPPHGPGFVSLELSHDVSTTSDANVFALVGDLLVVPSPHLLSVLPKLGTAAGGTVMHATGSHLRGGADETDVFYAGVRAPGGVFVSSALWIAEVPSAREDVGATSVQLTSIVTALAGKLPVLTSDGVEYVYTSLAQITTASPTVGGDGGGTLTTLQGGVVRDGVDLRCFFGSVAVQPSGVVSVHALQCVAPARAPGTVAALAAANNVVDALYLAHNAALAYVAEPRVYAASPLDGTNSGGTRVQLWVSSAGTASMLSAAPLLCRFDMLAALPLGDTVALEPLGARTTCASPLHAAGFVALQVSLLGGNHSEAGDLQFNVQPAPTTRMSWPAKAAASGGTVIWLYGRDLVVGVDSATLHVRFGGAQDDAVVLSPARIVSSSLIMVEVPAKSPPVDIDVDGGDGTLRAVSAADFAYAELPRLLAAAPNLGSVRGGTTVSLGGAGFAAGDANYCRFGTVGPILATFVTDVLLQCTTPAHAPGTPVPVAVSRANIVDFVSARGVHFEF